MPQMAPIGWAWVSLMVVVVYMFYFISLYFFYLMSFEVDSSFNFFNNMSWEW